MTLTHMVKWLKNITGNQFDDTKKMMKILTGTCHPD